MATIQERLTEAESAFHRLQLGESAVEVRDSDGSSVRYTPANASRLAAYIEDLRAQLAVETGSGDRHAGPMRLVF